MRLGWLSWILMGLALWLPGNGRLERFIQRSLQAEVGAAAGRVEVGPIDLNWTARSATLDRLAYVDQGEELALHDLELRVNWSVARGFFLEQAVARHGHLRFSESLIEGIQGTLGEVPKEPTPLDLAQIPALAIEDLRVELETPEWGDLDLGVVHASLQKDESGLPRLVGRMVPALEGNQGEFFLRGVMQSDGRLMFRSTARDLPLSPGFLPTLPDFDWVRDLYPEGRADLEATGHWAFSREALPHVQLQATLRGGELRLPWLSDRPEHTIVDVGIVSSAAFDPGQQPSFWARDAWEGRADVTARWKDAELQGQLCFARASTTESLVELWAHVPEIRLDEDLVELLGSGEWAQGLWDGLSLGGSLEVLAGVRTPVDWDPTRPETLERALALVPHGKASCAYVGGPNEDGSGVRNYGFPLPVTDVEGLVTHLVAPTFDLPSRLSLIGLEGMHPSGPVRANGSNHSVPLSRTATKEEKKRRHQQFDLDVRATGLTVNEEFRSALGGLSGLGGCERLTEQYQPLGGQLDLQLRLWRQTGQGRPSSDILLDVQDVDFTPENLKLNLQTARGQLTVLLDGRDGGGGAVSVDLHGDVEGCDGGVQVSGRLQGIGQQNMSWWKVLATGVNLNDTVLQERLGEQAPAALDVLGLTGRVDAEVDAVQSSDKPGEAWVEIRSGPLALHSSPPDLPHVVEEVAGRASIELSWPAVEQGGIGNPLASALVSWNVLAAGNLPLVETRVPLVLSAQGTTGSPALVSLLGADLELGDSQVRNSLEFFADSSTQATTEGEVGWLEREGTVDFQAQLTLPAADNSNVPSAPAPAVHLELSAHLERIGPQSAPILELLEGGGTYDGDLWQFDALQAELGGSPIRLTDVRLEPGSAEDWLRGRLSAPSLPIDEAHLQHFLDAGTLESLLGELACSGELGFADTQLELKRHADASVGVHLKGPVTLRNVSLRLGLPVIVHRAEDVALDLYYEKGRVRATAQVRDLHGEVAGRKLNETSMQVTYLDPRFTVEAFNGRFEGGHLRSIEGPGGAPSGFFSLDLEEPYAFSLAGEMDGVEVSRLLRGVFNSDFANRGKIDADMQLRGRISELSGVRGTGRFRLTDSGLWAIPVFQALFAQLGFESAAVFSRFDARFAVANGVIEMDHIRLKSDLLSLVGSGSVDMEGDLHHDLEVNYSLLDRLGPITRVIYEIQNSLLRITVRGNLDRPEVAAKGLFSQFFTPSSGGQKLPLPPYSKRGRRF